MLKTAIRAIALACLFVTVAISAGCTSAMTPEQQNVLAATCTSGQTFYGYIQAAATTEAVPASIMSKANDAYRILKPLCDKGSAATQTDIVLAGAQVYVLTKAWKDAT